MTNPAHLAHLRERLALVEARIASACRRAERSRSDITLVAVTKTIPVEIAGLLPELGVLDLGESRPQELWKKGAGLSVCRWHLVGHLQRNKVERTIRMDPLIHSIDSLALLEAIDKDAAKQQVQTRVLLEVNASREANKHGFAPEEVPELLPTINRLQNVRVMGLMTMAALDAHPERCRPTFAQVRELAERLREQVNPPHTLAHLSMGMSNDFEVAIEEGATLIRIGTALFEGIDLVP